MNLYLFEEYNNLRIETNKSKKEYERLLDKKAEYYFSLTHPKANNPKSENIGKPTGTSNPILQGIIKIDDINEKIECIKNIKDIKEYRLKLKEKELRESKEILDKIYILKYIDHLKTSYIELKTNYSKRQIYRFLEEIQEKINMAQNGTKLEV